ncbi:MAG: DNA cytosine methyltransferase, partial [Euryarchaeota archaeon]
MSLTVVELFAGVGGFRIGFEGPPEESDRSRFRVIWSNQWEPSTIVQQAAHEYDEKRDLKETQDPEIFSNGSDD